MKTTAYHKAASTLVLMAYLQRVVNGCGRIEREYAAGSGRMDLLVVHLDVRMAIEVKIWRENRVNPEKDGLVQIECYLNRLDLLDGFLISFDERAEPLRWEERLQSSQAATASDRLITVMRG